jgi:hypothetical protein
VVCGQRPNWRDRSLATLRHVSRIGPAWRAVQARAAAWRAVQARAAAWRAVQARAAAWRAVQARAAAELAADVGPGAWGGMRRQVLECEGQAHPGYRFLARTYAAEALCVLHQPAAAADMLRPLVVPAAASGADPLLAKAPPDAPAASRLNGPAGPAAEGAAESLDKGLWRGHGAEGRRLYAGPGWWETASGPGAEAGAGCGEAWRAARCAALSNTAAVHIVRHALPAAQRAIADALESDPRAPHALLLAVYLEMRQGNAAAALAILKRRRAPAQGPAP